MVDPFRARLFGTSLAIRPAEEFCFTQSWVAALAIWSVRSFHLLPVCPGIHFIVIVFPLWWSFLTLMYMFCAVSAYLYGTMYFLLLYFTAFLQSHIMVTSSACISLAISIAAAIPCSSPFCASLVSILAWKYPWILLSDLVIWIPP